jgi:hypothetical protein
MVEDTRSVRGGCAINIFNVFTAMLIIAMLAILLLAVFLVAVPDNPLLEALGLERTEPESTPTRVQVAVVPTVTPSHTPVPVIPPTRTPASGQAVATNPPLGTLRPSLTPSITPTFPPPTPSRTLTPTPTDTPTPGPSPTATNTRSAFPFTKDLASPQYLQNYANSAGCNWLGIAGVVYDLEGNPVGTSLFRVHIWDSGVDARVDVGGAPAYGPSGYEQFLFDAPRIQEHNVQLETVSGTAVSQVYRVQTRASCNQNLLFLEFVQNH